MPSDLQSIADPGVILVAWAGGLALVAAAVSYARIVGPGFSWLSGGVAIVVGLPGALAENGWSARVGLACIAVAVLGARNRPYAAVLFAMGGIAYAIEAGRLAGWLPAVTGVLALGGVGGEMALGHWYLVDPRLPRSALRVLAVGGVAGLLAEGALQVGLGVGIEGAAMGFWVLLATSVVLMVAVVAALRYPAYSGVMAATGLSYLALLTALGAVFVGRAVSAGLGPFNN